MATSFGRLDLRRAAAAEGGSAAIEAAGGVAVIVLAILALSGISELALSAIAAIVFGGALLMRGAAFAGEFAAQIARMSGTPSGARDAQTDVGVGMGIEIIAGIAAIALGIVALAGVAPAILLAAMVVEAGVALVLLAAAVNELDRMKMESAIGEGRHHVGRWFLSSAAGAQVLAGLAALVLGAVALGVGTGAGAPGEPVSGLTEVGLLVLGVAITISGTALAGRISQLLAPE